MTDHTLPDGQDRRRVVFLLLGIVLAGLVLRLIHFWALRDSAIPFRHLFVTTDDNVYYQWARTILAGDWLGRATYHPYFDGLRAIAPLETWYRWWGGKEVFQQAPLYPYIFAAMLAVTRHDFPAILLIQLLLGALQPVVMYLLAKRLWNYRVGLIAALITALYGPFVFYQGVFLRDWLAPILEPLALLAVVKASQQDSPGRWIVAGAALGVALLARETVQLLILLVLSWVVISRRKDPGSAVRISGWLIAGLLLALSPLIVRNVVVGAPAFALSNRAAEGIIEGWAADWFPVGLVQAPPSMKEILVASDGHLPGVIWGTIQTYRGDWVHLLEQVVTKLRGISDPFEFPNNISLYYGMEVSPVLRYMLGYWFVFPLGVAGLLMSLKNWRDHALGMLYVVATVGGLLASIILSRYRLELVAALILYAAVFVGQLLDAARQKHVRLVVVGGVLAGVTILVQQVVLPLGPEVKDLASSFDHMTSASVYANVRQFDRAVSELDRGLQKTAEYPYFSEPDTLMWYRHYYRAYQLLEEGDAEEARREAEFSRETLVPRDYTLLPMAQLYLRLQDFARARELLQAVVDLDPNSPFAVKATRLLARMRNPEQTDK